MNNCTVEPQHNWQLESRFLGCVLPSCEVTEWLGEPADAALEASLPLHCFKSKKDVLKICWPWGGSTHPVLRDAKPLLTCLVSKAKPCGDASVHLQLGGQRGGHEQGWSSVLLGSWILQCWSLTSLVDFYPSSYLPSGHGFCFQLFLSRIN